MIEFTTNRVTENAADILQAAFGKVPIRIESTGYISVEVADTPANRTKIKQAFTGKTRTVPDVAAL
jgi:hypothetical protein